MWSLHKESSFNFLHVHIWLPWLFGCYYTVYWAQNDALSTKWCIETGVVCQEMRTCNMSTHAAIAHAKNTSLDSCFLVIRNLCAPWTLQLKEGIEEGRRGGKRAGVVGCFVYMCIWCLMEGWVGVRLSLCRHDACDLKLPNVMLLTTVAVSFF